MGPVINSRTTGIHLDVLALDLFLLLGLRVVELHALSIKGKKQSNKAAVQYLRYNTYMEEANKSLQLALEPFNIGQITGFKRLKTTGNETYKVLTSEGTYLLRISPLDRVRGRSRNELLAEVEFTNLLFKKAIPISPFRMDECNNYLISIENKYGLIRNFDKGKAKTRISKEHIATFARLLGEIHHISEGYQTVHKRTHVWGPEVTYQHAKDSEGMLVNISEEFNYQSRILTLLKEVRPDKLPKGMIHEDLGKRHVLWDKSTITSIIDFDRCYYGYLIFDLGQAIRGWCFSENGKVNHDHLRTFIENYQMTRKLTSIEKTCLNKAVAFAFAERSLSFALRSVMRTDKKLAEYSVKQLLIAEDIISSSLIDKLPL